MHHLYFYFLCSVDNKQLGYVFSAPPHYAVPAMPTQMPVPIPFLSPELSQSSGRINFNLPYAMHANGDDLPSKSTMW